MSADTGSEFALILARMFSDTGKGVGGLLKDFLIMAYNNKLQKEWNILDHRGYKKLMSAEIENDFRSMKKEYYEKFKSKADEKGLDFVSQESNDAINIIIDKNDAEKVEEIFEEIKKEALEEMLDSENIKENDSKIIDKMNQYKSSINTEQSVNRDKVKEKVIER